MKLILIRHGETEWNRERRKMGQLDSPLSELGRLQIQSLAERLGSIEFSAIYSSDLGRAVSTADAIATKKSLDVVLDEGLRERGLGIFEGLTRTETRQRYPQEVAELKRNRFEYVIPDGESARQRLERSVRALTEISNRHPDEQVVVVSHAGVLIGFLEFVLGMPPGDGRHCRLDNASYNLFDCADGKWTLDTWNDTSHLADRSDETG